MSKAEQFIKDYTRSCSNVVYYHNRNFTHGTDYVEGSGIEVQYYHWLTPKQALAAVEIAREEMIDTLEVKEVDLDKEVANWWKDHYKKIKNDYKFEDYNGHYMENSTIISLAQYFFELGLKAKGE